jgi:5-methylcytosine-specific restriction endonuclease McrA
MSGHPFYDTSDWRTRIRPRQLAREPMCRQCGQPASHVDHIKPIRQGGSKRDPHNLQSICHACHNQKTSLEREGGTWRLDGYFEDGSPRDPAHPFYTGGGSITGKTGQRPASPTETE